MLLVVDLPGPRHQAVVGLGQEVHQVPKAGPRSSTVGDQEGPGAVRGDRFLTQLHVQTQLSCSADTRSGE